MFCSPVNTVISRRPEKCPAQRCRGHEAGRGLPVNLAKGFGGTGIVNYIPTSCGRKVFARLSKKIRKAAARSMVTGCTGPSAGLPYLARRLDAGWFCNRRHASVRAAGGRPTRRHRRAFCGPIDEMRSGATWQRRNRTSRVGVSAFRPLVNDSA
jgi:hypothetical protein